MSAEYMPTVEWSEKAENWKVLTYSENGAVNHTFYTRTKREADLLAHAVESKEQLLSALQQIAERSTDAVAAGKARIAITQAEVRS